MVTLSKDFEFLKSILTKFFSQSHIRKRLNSIEDLEITGWEIWLQVELFIFLTSIDEVSDVYREERCDFDKRKDKSRNLCAIDFIIRQRKAHSFIPLEIKQNKVASDCIRNMLADITKYRKIRASDLISERDIWCLGVHRQVEEETIKDYIREADWDFNWNYVYIAPIKGTNYMMTLL